MNHRWKRENTGGYAKRYEGKGYHLDDRNGRLILCGCYPPFIHDHRFGYRNLRHTHKRDNEWEF